MLKLLLKSNICLRENATDLHLGQNFHAHKINMYHRHVSQVEPIYHFNINDQWYGDKILNKK